MMSFESPKKAAECFQSPLVASSTARMGFLFCNFGGLS